MQSEKVEYQKGKWLVVDYSPLDDKPEYRQPVLCRAQDMGKVIYGKWIIGGEQGNGLTGEVYADDEEKFYTAYRLVKGAGISCNFPLNEGVPFFVKTSYPYDVNRTDISWEYAVNSYIDSYSHHREPETDALDNGMIYIKMPSGAEAQQTDGAAKEKFADRPQILKGDIVRVVGEFSKEESCHVVSAVRDAGVYSEYPHYHYNEEIVAVYRFDGRNFKCIWESEEYKLQKWNNALADVAETARRVGVSWDTAAAALVNIAKAERDKARKASEESND